MHTGVHRTNKDCDKDLKKNTQQRCDYCRNVVPFAWRLLKSLERRQSNSVVVYLHFTLERPAKERFNPTQFSPEESELKHKQHAPAKL